MRTSWIAPAVVSAAVVGTAALSVAAASPVPAARATVLSAKTAAPGITLAAKPGWLVVAKVGPANSLANAGAFGTFSARGAKTAWSVWRSQGYSIVDRWTGTKWAQVTVPAKLAPYLRETAAYDGQAGYLWLFSTYKPGQALLYSGGKWTTEKIPSWVLRKPKGDGAYNVTAAVFGRTNVWVFSLGSASSTTGNYAARFNGHAWAKVKLPATPVAVAADAASDMWALGPASVMHWTPGHGWQTVKSPLLPPGALPTGTIAFTDVTATSATDVSLIGQVTASAGPDKDTWFVEHWNGKSWGFNEGTTNFVGSVAPDGHGGLWADGVNDNPGGFWTLYHLSSGKWTSSKLPSVVWTQSPLTLTQIPGTRSLWAADVELPGQTGGKGLILRYNP
jgi:hypothetical protein